jgi:transcriptional regulator with XRE-family HTH domain
MDARRLSARAVAAATGVSPTTVARWLDNADDAEPRLSQARTLAVLLGVPLEYLADDRQDALAPADGETPIFRLVGDPGPAK